MKSITDKLLVRIALLCLAVAPAVGLAIEPDEVKEYGEVFRISGRAVSPDLVEVSWDIEEGYYLYHNKFLRFTAPDTAVELGEPLVPAGKKEFDPLLGEEVIKFHGRLTVSLPVTAPGMDLLQLEVRSQGCLEGVLCYPPTVQKLTVDRSAFVGAVDEPLRDLVGDPSFGHSTRLIDEKRSLPPGDAFRYEAIGLNADTILARFNVQPGYYLYVDKFAFRVVGAPGFAVRGFALPEGTVKDDPEFGPVPVIYGEAEIPVQLNRPAGPQGPLVLEADFQGCRDGEICYPPQTARVELLMAAAAEAVVLPVAEPETAGAAMVAGPAPEPPLSEQDRLARLLIENPPGAMFAFFVAGLLLAFTPCVFPMVPILSGIIAGQGERLTTARAFLLSVVYVLAMALTYTVAGVLAGLFGKNLQAAFQNPWVISGFIAVFVFLAFSMFGFYELQLPGRWQTALAERSNRQAGGRYGGVAVMGLLSALIVGPCVAPPLAAALIVIGASGSAALGGTALFALSIGMGVPLVIYGVSAGKLIPRAGAWMNAVKAVFGVGLLALGVWMLERIVQGPVILLLWGLLAIGSGVFMGAFQRLGDSAGHWRRLWKSLGLALVAIGAMELVGAAAGGDNWLRPLERLGSERRGAEAEQVEFRRIKSLEELSEALAEAGAADRPAMLDFYADWCVECIRMERKTFPDETVQLLLTKIRPLQADVTANDETDQALMRQFGIIGPPAILFFDRHGREMKPYRLVGYFTPEEFGGHLQKVIEAQ